MTESRLLVDPTPRRVGAALIRPAEPADAEAAARCYTEALATTYRGIMPPQFAIDRRAELATTAERFSRTIAAAEASLALGTQPHRQVLIAEDRPHNVVGLAVAGPGIEDWERKMDVEPPPKGVVNLDRLYLDEDWHGTGLGQAMLDQALPDGRGAWLWIVKGNDRALSFYRRNGFVRYSADVLTGPTWFNRPMFRMWRPGRTEAR